MGQPRKQSREVEPAKRISKETSGDSEREHHGDLGPDEHPGGQLEDERLLTRTRRASPVASARAASPRARSTRASTPRARTAPPPRARRPSTPRSAPSTASPG